MTTSAQIALIFRLFHLFIKVFHFWLLTLVVQSRYDKVTYSELKDRYLHNVVEVSPPFTQPAKDRLNDNINRLLDLYAKCVSRGDKTAARQQLRLHQRENIAWERDTVWRQMIGRQRRGEDSTQGVLGATLVQEPEPTVVDIPTPVGRFKITKRLIFKVAALVVFILLLNVQVVKGGEANRCFAILTFCTILWATEVKGFCCSSCFSFFLYKSNRLFRFSWRQCLFHCFSFCSGSSATTTRFQWRLQRRHSKTCEIPLYYEWSGWKWVRRFVFSAMFSPTIMLLIGGFTISSALSKTNIDRVLITRVLSLAGTKPSRVLLAFMGVSCFASMWIRYSRQAMVTVIWKKVDAKRHIVMSLPPLFASPW